MKIPSAKTLEKSGAFIIKNQVNIKTNAYVAVGIALGVGAIGLYFMAVPFPE